MLQNNDFCQSNYTMKLSKYIIAFLLLGTVIFIGCDDGKEDEFYLIQRTKDYFNFSDNTRWVYDVVSDSSHPVETYTLQNKIRNIRAEGNSEIMAYDLVRDAQYKINVRCEVGPTEFADRISFLVEEGASKTVSAFVWAQTHRFYAENNDEINNIGADTLYGKAYQDVWQLKTKRNGDFKEIKFAKGYGLIYIDFKDGRKLCLKELNK